MLFVPPFSFDSAEEVCGLWSREQLEEMNHRFVVVVERAFELGLESQISGVGDGSGEVFFEWQPTSSRGSCDWGCVAVVCDAQSFRRRLWRLWLAARAFPLSECALLLKRGFEQKCGEVVINARFLSYPNNEFALAGTAANRQPAPAMSTATITTMILTLVIYGPSRRYRLITSRAAPGAG
jgi:hypothetical protein